MEPDQVLDATAQLGIFVFGVAAVWLVAQRGPIRRWGYVCGLVAEPFWLYSSIAARQWGVVAMCFIYAAGWIVGLRNHWRAG